MSVPWCSSKQLGSRGADDQQRDARGPGRARCSTKASSASSAQCRSSNTSTAGPRAGDPRGSAARRRSSPRATPGRLEAEQRPQPLAQPCCVVARRAATASSLASTVADVVGIEDAGVRLDDLPERPERDALAVGQAAALAPGDEPGRCVEGARRTRRRGGSCRCRARRRAGELRRRVAAASRRAHAETRARPRGRRTACRSGRRAEAGARDAAARPASRAPAPLLPLAATRLRAPRRRWRLGELVGERADGDAAGRRGGLQPRRRVDGVAGEEAARRSPGVTSRRTRASPVLTPTRTCSGVPSGRVMPSSASTMRRPARTARSGSSSCTAGTPKTPTTASPMNFSTVPPWDSISPAGARREYSPQEASTSSGSAASLMAVKPTRSQKRVVTTLRSSGKVRVAVSSAPSSAPHFRQKREPSGSLRGARRARDHPRVPSRGEPTTGLRGSGTFRR